MDLFTAVSSMKSAVPETPRTNAFQGKGADTTQKLDQKGPESKNFQDALKKVEQEKTSTSDKKQSDSPKVQELEKNIQSLEEKIKTLKKDAGPEQKEQLEQLAKFLTKLKTLLARMKSGQDHKSQNTLDIDLLSLMSQALEEIAQTLDQPNGISKMTEKLDAIQGKMDKHSTQEKSTRLEENSLFKQEETNATKVEAKQDKVKIVDRRSTAKRSMNTQRAVVENKQAGTEKTTNLFSQELAQATRSDHSQDNAAQAVQNLNIRQMAIHQVASRQYTSYSSGMTRAHMESMMSSITGKAVVTLQDGKSEVRLRLNPPELGHMKLNFSLEDGKMVGKIVVSTQEAKMLFDQNLWDLQRSLQNAGINVQGMEVNVGNEDQASQEQELFASQGGESALLSEDAVAQESTREYHNLYDSSVNYIA